jgi:hypothetical protein
LWGWGSLLCFLRLELSVTLTAWPVGGRSIALIEPQREQNLRRLGKSLVWKDSLFLDTEPHAGLARVAEPDDHWD